MKKLYFSVFAVCIFIFLFSVSSFAANEAEPNNSQNAATDISVNSPVTGNIENSDDRDWYRFQVPSDGVVSFTLSHQVISNTDALWKVAVFQSDGVTSAATSEQIEWNCAGNKDMHSSQLGLQAGTYYVRVSSYFSIYNTCEYTLNVSFTASAVFEKERNEKPETATPISVNTAYKGAISNASDKDWYKFSLDSDGSITLSFSHENISSTDLYWRFRLYQSDGVTPVCGVSSLEWNVAGNSDLTTSKIGLPKGSYYVCVISYFSICNASTYSLCVNFESSDNFEKETNGSYSTANEISPNKVYYGSITNSDDRDMYKVTIPASGKITLNLTHNILSSQDLYWRVFLYKDDGVTFITGNKIYWEISGNKNFTSPEIGVPAGDYYVKVEACWSGGFSRETYELKVDFVEASNYEKETNSNSSNATPVKLTTDFNGSSANGDDEDWYVFDVADTTDITVVFEHKILSSSDTVWTLRAYKSDGVSAAAKENYVPGNKIAYYSLGTLSSGRYYLKVAPVSSRHNSTTYTFRINGAHTCTGVWNVTVEPECEKTGKRQKICSLCGALMIEENVPEKGHTFNEWNIIKPADCNTTGEREAVCVDCGYKKKETVPMTAHLFGEWEETVAATCFEEGTRQRACTICDITASEQTQMLEHDFGEWTILSVADCENAGKKEQICTLCEFVETEEIAALGHIYKQERIVKGSKFIPPIVKERRCDVCKTLNTYKDWSYVWIPVLIALIALCTVVSVISYIRLILLKKERKKISEKNKIPEKKKIKISTHFFGDGKLSE